jgi:ubiquinone/menaquinone biosynthesis C-methylase UbiE
MRKIFEKYCELPTVVRKPLWKIWHRWLSNHDKFGLAVFMNYGFSHLNGDAPIPLSEEDEPNRYSIQLYHHVATGIDIQGKDVLEVGCGRGGGGSYIMRYLKPNSYVGLDQSIYSTKFCNRYHDVENLYFVKGYAESLSFEDSSFDAVINIESSRCYADIDAFLSGVWRVLRPEGYLLLADLRTDDEVDDFKQNFLDNGFSIERTEDISQNVSESLARDSSRRTELIEEHVPKYLHKAFKEFSGVEGTDRYHLFSDGKMKYWYFVLKKTGSAAAG